MSTFNLNFKSPAQLPAVTTLSDSDLLIVQTALGTRKVTLGQIRSSTSGDSIPLTQKGAPSGVATLDESSTIPDVQIPSTITRDSELTTALATKADSSALTSHTSNQSNPHNVTAAQVGAVALTGNQTIAGTKTFLNGLTLGTAGISAQITGFPNVTLSTYNRSGSSDTGFQAPMLKCSRGRFDFDPLDAKCEFRVSGTTTQFNIFNVDSNLPYITINSNQTVSLFNTLSVAGGVTATGVGSFNSLSLATSLSLANGGTGATSASQARTNLGAASSGANSDITSLTGLTTPLSVAQGGTGATTTTGLRTSIGAAASGSNSDITALSGLTTPLSVAQGGTGASTLTGFRTTIGAAASGVNADITRLNGLTTALSISQGGTGSTSATSARSNLGTLGSKFVTITGNYTILPADVGTVFNCSVSGGGSTFTLPSAGSNQGFLCTIRKTDSSVNAVTIARSGTDTINGATSIQLTQQFQAVTLVSSGSGGWSILANERPASGAGKVLQVVYGFTGTQISNTTATFVDTGLSATITPQFATSRILVTYFVNGVAKIGANTSVNLQILRNSTALTTVNSAFTGSAADLSVGSSGNSILDQPSTTSALTYKIQIANNNAAGTVFAQYFGSSSSTIVLMEVAN